MGNIVTIGDASNAYNSQRKIYAIHTHIEEKSDGSRITIEKSLDFSKQKDIEGSQWLIPGTSEWHGKEDKDSNHFFTENESFIEKVRITTDDGKGNKTIDEKAVKKEDFTRIKGTKRISNQPDIDFDKRQWLLEDFASQNHNPFESLGGGSIKLLGNDGGSDD